MAAAEVTTIFLRSEACWIQNDSSNKEPSATESPYLEFETDHLKPRLSVNNDENLSEPSRCTQLSSLSLGLQNDSICTALHRTYESLETGTEHPSSVYQSVMLQQRLAKSTLPVSNTCFPIEDSNKVKKDVNNVSYHLSLAGCILLTSVHVSKIFYYAEHGCFQEFRKLLELHYVEAVQMKNEKNQISIDIPMDLEYRTYFR
ncbi:unnamed protein product [Didymodactylos carnosus]|uniref:Uncharacterized protein n=1 Tax=Didymodactylos carnosus TaxID=1234261 RepID=A0A8S2ENA6_9BILA|nr:unnamed protein product [Didymodactylos carnosus]CAF4074634.1 unnamed protein product [Didymodactylos carnosus]